LGGDKDGGGDKAIGGNAKSTKTSCTIVADSSSDEVITGWSVVNRLNGCFAVDFTGEIKNDDRAWTSSGRGDAANGFADDNGFNDSAWTCSNCGHAADGVDSGFVDDNGFERGSCGGTRGFAGDTSLTELDGSGFNSVVRALRCRAHSSSKALFH
jgi:hypothetical protein